MTARTAARRLTGAAASLLFSALFLGACRGEIRFDDKADRDATSGDALLLNDVNQPEAGPPPSCTDRPCPSPLRCNEATGECVACASDADCAGATLRKCDLSTFRCVACLASKDCGPEHECDTTTHRCLDECDVAGEPCPNPQETCDTSERVCVRCRSNANCASAPEGPICDRKSFKCGACAGNADCSDEHPVCDRRDGTCVACLTGKDCSTGQCNSITRQCIAL